MPRKPQLKITASEGLLDLADRIAEELGTTRSDLCRGIVTSGLIEAARALRWATVAYVQSPQGSPRADHGGPGPTGRPPIANQTEMVGMHVGPPVGPPVGPLARARDPDPEEESISKDPPCSPPVEAGPTGRPPGTTYAPGLGGEQVAVQPRARELARELAALMNRSAGTAWEPDAPLLLALVAQRLAGTAPDDIRADAAELREVVRGVALLGWRPHMITPKAVFGPGKYQERREQARAALADPGRAAGTTGTAGARRAAARKRRR